MASLIVTKEQELLEGGKVGYGSCIVWTKYGEMKMYEIRLSAKAASMVSEGDTIEWGRGQSYGPVQDCTGQIIKKNGQKIQLTGYADIGVGTGHPPYLGLKMEKTHRLVEENGKKKIELVDTNRPLIL